MVSDVVRASLKWNWPLIYCSLGRASLVNTIPLRHENDLSCTMNVRIIREQELHDPSSAPHPPLLIMVQFDSWQLLSMAYPGSQAPFHTSAFLNKRPTNGWMVQSLTGASLTFISAARRSSEHGAIQFLRTPEHVKSVKPSTLPCVSSYPESHVLVWLRNPRTTPESAILG